MPQLSRCSVSTSFTCLFLDALYVCIETSVSSPLLMHFQTFFYVLGQLAPHAANHRGYSLQFGRLNRRIVNNFGAPHPSAEVHLERLVFDS
jgi:hypothetical protein